MSIAVSSDPAPSAAVVALADRIDAEDGAPPLSDESLARLGDPDVREWIARDGDDVVGYAQLADGTLELAAERAAIEPLLDATTSARDTGGSADRQPAIWSHGRRSRLIPALESRDGVRVRELHQLRRPLGELPPDPPLGTGIEVRAFVPGRDDRAWLAVNAAAFASHREQGRWTGTDLEARIEQPWFDAAGFLLAERDGQLLGFHWTKVHPDGTGEVYVLGVAPDGQGLGLGSALLVRGLRYLAEQRRCREVLLYVDGDNPAAMHLYEREGFRPHDLDVQWHLA